MSDPKTQIIQGLETLVEQAANLKFESFKAEFLTKHFDLTSNPRPHTTTLEKRQTKLNEAIFQDRFTKESPNASRAHILAALYRFRDLTYALHRIEFHFTHHLLDYDDFLDQKQQAMDQFHKGLQVPQLELDDLI